MSRQEINSNTSITYNSSYIRGAQRQGDRVRGQAVAPYGSRSNAISGDRNLHNVSDPTYSRENFFRAANVFTSNNNLVCGLNGCTNVMYHYNRPDRKGQVYFICNNKEKHHQRHQISCTKGTMFYRRKTEFHRLHSMMFEYFTQKRPLLVDLIEHHKVSTPTVSTVRIKTVQMFSFFNFVTELYAIII
ncbi:uncharacterized protein BX663DRAFT_556725 [Cokeromyces recurvatus]|uniref:uncharacterized protein n=1 Tax=Cokeromyces recurvatus TaxID=90255 RepID=UPI00221F6FA8|nr:uncharacterized protein BX663DRAFT_556725 [Cokeromyces recurvatus]KAI7897444.1 hypothetical protein BX663DRAFT_556725 [Cokeromyces recurvatus]